MVGVTIIYELLIDFVGDDIEIVLKGQIRNRFYILSKENERLRRENKKLQHRLKQAETIIEAQKKISEIMGVQQPDVESD